jgi:hypothetical protein
MMKTFIKDLPIYINGFCVGWLAFGREWGTTEIILIAFCAISFVWGMNINKTK